jgi:hypothetical protein
MFRYLVRTVPAGSWYSVPLMIRWGLPIGARRRDPGASRPTDVNRANADQFDRIGEAVESVGRARRRDVSAISTS